MCTVGGIFELLMIFWATFPPFYLSWDLSGYNGRINFRRIYCRGTADSLLGWLFNANFDVFCGTNDAWDSLRISNRVNETVYMLKYTCIIKRWDRSQGGCEVVVKAKYLCYTQRKEDTDDADHNFNSISKANKNIWRPSLVAIFGRWIITTSNLFHGSSYSPLAYGIFGELSHPCCPSQSIFPPSAVQFLVSLFGNNWSVS